MVHPAQAQSEPSIRHRYASVRHAGGMARPSRNDIRDAATAFAREWRDDYAERGEAQTFWTEFLLIFGIQRRRVNAAFERHARRQSTGGLGFIDLLWPGMLLAEHKSRHGDLDAALDQALDYLDSLTDQDFPRLVVVSDFERFIVLDLEDDERVRHSFLLKDLPRNIDRLLVLAGYTTQRFEDQDAANIVAVDLLSDIYKELRLHGYANHSLRILIVRILFLLFGDDTGLWPRNQFLDLIQNRTAEDGSDLGMWMVRLFNVLDTDASARSDIIDEDLAAFPYVNGGLFHERIEAPDTSRRMRGLLLAACMFDWSKISPAIFGSMFQAVMNPEARRQIGAHYTSERDILKVLRPLFLTQLEADLEACGSSKPMLQRLHQRLGDIRVLDPACGCGNFLVIAYRELRRIETALLEKLHPTVQRTLGLGGFRKVWMSNFYGIEIEEYPVRIAETAMYLADHLENEALGKAFGANVIDLPLSATAQLVCGNALRLDWNSVLPASECTYVVGNPPFVGKKARTASQQEDMTLIFGHEPAAGILDYVAAWYRKACRYMDGTPTRAALVSTNSITQGEQVAPLFAPFLTGGFEVDFAHRTFNWRSEAEGAAHVHCVIVGFSQSKPSSRLLYDYPAPGDDPLVQEVSTINPYLVAAPNVIVTRRGAPLASVPRAVFGSMPNDGGHLLLDKEDAAEVCNDPIASKYIRPMVSARQMLHGENRYCLWLEGAPASDIRSSATLSRRVRAVRAYRASSTRAATKRLAVTPALFGEIRQPRGRYLAVPRHPSAQRWVAPMAFFDSFYIVSDSMIAIEGADVYLFGVMQSALFTSWLGAVGGRIKSDFRVSVELVYNTFPFPNPSAAAKGNVMEAAYEVLAEREKLAPASLADLYDPLSSPRSLVRAHGALDRAVERCFGRRQALRTDGERLALLFERFEAAIRGTELPGLTRRPRRSR